MALGDIDPVGMSAPLAYDDLIMDHIKRARNYRAIDGASRTANGSNPLCGDEMTVYVRIEGERIAEVAFQCTCCGISMASASIMTETVQGKSVEDAKRVLADVVSMLGTRAASSLQPMTPERLALLETVTKYPARERCAALAWTTLQDALT
jgi:nitrogen fixation NifU-like protein